MVRIVDADVLFGVFMVDSIVDSSLLDGSTVDETFVLTTVNMKVETVMNMSIASGDAIVLTHTRLGFI
jgi:hypothetical protein